VSSDAGESQRADIAVPAVILAVFAWGMGPLMVRGMGVSGYTVALYRMWFGAPAMLIANKLWGKPLTWVALKACVVPGLFFGSSMMMGFVAVRTTSIANATLIGALTPAIILLGANRFVGERSDLRRIPFALLAFAGLALVILGGVNNEGASLNGDVWAAINVMCFSVYFVILKKRRNDGFDGWTFLAGVFIVGCIVITPVCVLMADDTRAVGGWDWLLLLGMVLGPGLVGHGLISWASRHLPVTTTSLLTLGSPVISVFGAWLIYDQNLNAVQFLGAVLVLGGLAGSVWDKSSGSSPAPKSLIEPLV